MSRSKLYKINILARILLNINENLVMPLQGSSTLADLGTEQVEFIGLSQRTGNPKYQEKVQYLST
jgi:hypothetical protein